VRYLSRGSLLTPHSCRQIPQRGAYMGRRSQLIYDPKNAHLGYRGSLCHRNRAYQSLYSALLPSSRIARCLQSLSNHHLGRNWVHNRIDSRFLHKSACWMSTSFGLLGAIGCQQHNTRSQVQLQRGRRCHNCRWCCFHVAGCHYCSIAQFHLLESSNSNSPKTSPNGNIRYCLLSAGEASPPVRLASGLYS
jgi:hypothetical protein